jgi:hypothetical protein
VLRFIAALTAALALAGCASTQGPQLTALPVPTGPEAEVIDQVAQQPLACLSTVVRPDSRHTFGVLDVIDKTGSENRVGNDSFGTFMSQGTSDQLVSALGTIGVMTVELSPSYRAVVDWTSNKGGNHSLGPLQAENIVGPDGKPISTRRLRTVVANIRTPTIGLIGAITTLDVLPGGGASGGAYGASLYYNKNSALAQLDLRAVEMPGPKGPGGKVVAHVVVKKQIVQDGFNLTLDRYFTIGNQAKLINFEAGMMNREPMKASNRTMVNLAAAEVVAQVLGHYQCMARPPAEPMVASLK